VYDRPLTSRPSICGALGGRAVARSATDDGMLTSSPTIMTQARTDIGPIIRLKRDEHSVAMAQDVAAPRPPSKAITVEV